MKIVAVASIGSGSGKTIFIERLLEAFPARFTALKFTHPHDDEAPLEDREKDTGRFLAAGARRALLWSAPRGREAAAWQDLAGRALDRDELLVVEGNRAAAVCRPDLLFFVVNPRKPRHEWKQGIEEALRAADALIWNGERPDTRLLPHAPRRVLAGDMTKPLRESFPEAASLVEALIARD